MNKSFVLKVTLCCSTCAHLMLWFLLEHPDALWDQRSHCPFCKTMACTHLGLYLCLISKAKTYFTFSLATRSSLGDGDVTVSSSARQSPSKRNTAAAPKMASCVVFTGIYGHVLLSSNA